MKIIISPAKIMEVDNDIFMHKSYPLFIEKTKKIRSKLKSMSVVDLKKLYKANDNIIKVNQERFKQDLNKNLTCAIMAYKGLQYKYLRADLFSDKEFDYIDNNLRILSGFYGVLRPFDGIIPYRLEMQAKLEVGKYKNLYSFWEETINDYFKDENLILNLASKEYSCIIKSENMVTCHFMEKSKNKLVEKATLAKMARGEMVRYLAINNIKDIEGIEKFNQMNFLYSKDLSDEHNLVFVRG